MRPKVSEGQTKPPAYYNEGTLLTAMEKGNLGTVATRADIIDKLFNSFLMEKKDKDIRVTSKGRQLLGLVPEDLKKPELTADWEKKQLAISEGRLKKVSLFLKSEVTQKRLSRRLPVERGSFDMRT